MSVQSREYRKDLQKKEFQRLRNLWRSLSCTEKEIKEKFRELYGPDFKCPPQHVDYTKPITWKSEKDLSNWEKKFIGLAKHIASWSKDPSTQVGAVVATPDNRIHGHGYNGIPERVKDDVLDRWEKRPQKYLWVEHAERNALYQASRHEGGSEGCTLYATAFPCADCSRAIIQCGIKRLVSPYYSDAPTWFESWQVAEEMMIEASVDITAIMWW